MGGSGYHVLICEAPTVCVRRRQLDAETPCLNTRERREEGGVGWQQLFSMSRLSYSESRDGIVPGDPEDEGGRTDKGAATK